jgi:hypothetical protein
MLSLKNECVMHYGYLEEKKKGILYMNKRKMKSILQKIRENYDNTYFTYPTFDKKDPDH